MKKILFFFVLLSFHSFSQNETQKWYFGNKAGLDFATNPPTILTNGMMTTSEGCATIADGSGNLLFYTDGSTVYDQTHAAMANGTGLLGFSSSSQSGIIVKQPGNSVIYYVFTQGAQNNGLRYSIVDMSLAAGMGSVTTKNIILSNPSSEKLTSVKHCNGVDVWVLSHDQLGNNYRAYLVTSSGVNTTPIVSAVGLNYTGVDYIGCIKLSPNGRKIATALYGNSACYELCDFDNATGIVSNPLTLGTAYQSAYGCEFSPDCSKLYGTRYANGVIYQWDLCAGSPTAIVASEFTVSPSVNTSTVPNGKGQLQLTKDGKIYVARANQSFVGIIYSPNTYGAGCNYVDVGQSVAPKICTYGLPNFINSFFKPIPPPFTFSSTCSGVDFMTPSFSSTMNAGCSFVTNSVTGQQWDFGDPTSGTSNTATSANPSHTYSVSGTYTVQLILFTLCTSDTIRLPVTAVSASVLAISGNLSICKGEKTILTASGANNYTWSIGAQTSTISLNPTQSSVYSLVGQSGSCKTTKLFTVTVSPCTGIEQLNSSLNSVQIYPNPVDDKLVIETESPLKFTLMNQLGKVVLESSFNVGKHSIDVTSLENGIYTAQFVDGKVIKNIRVVKLK